MYAKGPDLSKYNGRGDWPAVKAAGVSFVIIKAGGVYSNTGVPYIDNLLEDHISGARSVGIPYGLYWYFLPFVPVRSQIEFYQKIIDHYAPSIPSAFIDVESNNGQSAAVITSALQQFLPAFSDMQHPAVIYTRQSWWDVNVKPDTWGGYDLWASRWRSGLTSPWSDGYYKFRDWKTWTFWQYEGDNNAKAKLYGFPGPPNGDPDIDLDWFNGDDAAFRNWAGLEQEQEPTLDERVTDLERWVTALEGRC
jgi:lysozyme